MSMLSPDFRIGITFIQTCLGRPQLYGIGPGNIKQEVQRLVSYNSEYTILL